MAETQTWRVVLASGEVREVRVNLYGALWVAGADESCGYSTAETARGAVARFATAVVRDIVEILAPGEFARAELRAQAWREGAEAMRAEAAEVAAGSWATHPAHRGMCAAARAVADEILSLPVPPCPEVSR